MSKTILVVEDDRRYRKILIQTFSSDEFVVKTAENGEEALALIEKEEIDLILLDLLMPKMDGISFYHNMQSKLKKHVPIVVLTNVPDEAAYGPDIKDVLIKSNISLDELLEKIKNYLK